MTRRFAEVVGSAFIVAVSVCWTDPALAYEGFGADTPGGTGQPVYHVTTLNDSGPGSLRDAVSQSNRHIVFDVGGTIDLTGGQNIDADGVSFLTIDGSTAPPPGITIIGAALRIRYGAHDIIVKDLRVRNGSDDNFQVFNAHDVVFDHCSASHAGDGNLDVTAGSFNVTVQWCVFGPSAAGPMLISTSSGAGTKWVTVHHSLFSSQQPAGVGERNPLVHAAPDTIAVSHLMADIRNNVIWGWGLDGGSRYGYGTGLDYGATANILNNFYQTTWTNPTLPGLAIEFNHNGGGAQAYIAGSVSGNGIDLDAYGNVATPFPSPAVTTEPTCIAAARVLQEAGARPLDSVDRAIVSSVSLANCPVAGDTQAPTVSVTAPADGTTVSGGVTVSALASDNVAVVGVQFQLDGVDLGSEDTSAPYDLAWNTRLVGNGPHSLAAVARDAAGFTTASSPITVTVSNANGPGWWPDTVFGIRSTYVIIGVAAGVVAILVIARLLTPRRRLTR